MTDTSRETAEQHIKVICELEKQLNAGGCLVAERPVSGFSTLVKIVRALLDERDMLEQAVGNLLAVINRDGGHNHHEFSSTVAAIVAAEGVVVEYLRATDERDAAIARAEKAERERENLKAAESDAQAIMDSYAAENQRLFDRAEKAETELNELRKELLTYANRNDILVAQHAAWAKQLYLVNPSPLMRSIPDTESGLDVLPVPVLRPEKLVDLLDKLENAEAALEAARIEACRWGLEAAKKAACDMRIFVTTIYDAISVLDPAQIVKGRE